MERKNESRAITRKTTDIFYSIDEHTDNLCYRKDILPIMNAGLFIHHFAAQTVNDNLKKTNDPREEE